MVEIAAVVQDAALSVDLGSPGVVIAAVAVLAAVIVVGVSDSAYTGRRKVYVIDRPERANGGAEFLSVLVVVVLLVAAAKLMGVGF